MKTFCENIWHSLTQEKEEKKSQGLGQNSFSFHVAMWVKEPSLSLSKCVCVGVRGGRVGVVRAPFQVLKGA